MGCPIVPRATSQTVFIVFIITTRISPPVLVRMDQCSPVCTMKAKAQGLCCPPTLHKTIFCFLG